MSAELLLHEALLFLVATVVVIPIGHRLGVSPVIVFVVAGLALGPSGLDLLRDSDTATALGEIGVTFLLFAIGLELSLRRLKAMRRLVLGLGAAQVLCSGLAIWGAAALAGLDMRTAVAIAAGLALSSTAVALRVLRDTDTMATRAGRAVIAVLLFQDLAAIPLLVLMPLLGQDELSMLHAFGEALVKGVLAFGLTLAGGRLLLRPLFRIVARTHSPEAFAALTLLTALGVGWLTAHAGLSMALGAFFAGSVIAETEYRHQVEGYVEWLQGLLLGLFFMLIGLRLDLGVALSAPVVVAATVTLMLLLKLGAVLALARLFGFGWPDAIRIAFPLAGAGEFAIILLDEAAEGSVVAPALDSALRAAVAIGMILIPPMAWLGRRLAERLEGTPDPDTGGLADAAEALSGHLVIAGYGRVGRTVARLADAAGTRWIAMDLDIDTVERAMGEGSPVFFADIDNRAALHAAGCGRATAVVLTLDVLPAALRAVRLLKQEYPGVPIVARARDERHRDELAAAGADAVVPETLESALQLGALALRAAGAPRQDADSLLDRLRAEGLAVTPGQTAAAAAAP